MNKIVISPQVKKKAVIGVVAVVFLFILVIASGPYTGFFVGGNPYAAQIENLNSELSTTQANLQETSASLDTCESDLESKDAELTETSNSLATTQTSLQTCNTDLENSQSDLSTARQSLEVKTAEATQLQADKTQLETDNSLLVSQNDLLEQGYNNLAANSAKDICCVRRVFDATLTHYYIENDKIVCTSDDTKTAFTC